MISKRELTDKIFACSCALMLVGSAPGAFAQANDGAPFERVRLADLDFNTSANARIALRRIEGAAARVCGGEPSGIQMHMHHLYLACRTEAISRALDQVNQPTLTQLNRSDRPAANLVAAR